jgi:hypothetical protein
MSLATARFFLSSAARIASPMLPPPINVIFIMMPSYMIVILLLIHSVSISPD